tara:strand:- start:9 stop:362 length:354 start_codon:yes stop_codon:yes gene_type:complete
MNDLIPLERDKFDEIYEKLEFMLLNLEKAKNEMSNESLYNLVDKIRLFNKDLDNLNSFANDILLDIRDNVSLIDDSINDRLEEEKYNNRLIKNFYPLFLLYMLNDKEKLSKNINDID